MKKPLLCLAFCILLSAFCNDNSFAQNTITTDTVLQLSTCAGGNVIVPFTATGSYLSGNQFIAQLSNPFGQFTNPVNIGQISFNIGYIFATIPQNATFGFFYKIRVVSTNPAITGTTSPNFVIITSIPQLATITANPGNTVCQGDTTTLSVLFPAQKYQWSTGNTTQSIQAVQPGNYNVVVTDYLGCTASGSITVTMLALPIANAGPDVTITYGLSTSLTATGGVQYSWSPVDGLSNATINNPIANPTVTTTYIVSVTDAKGCDNTDTVIVYVKDASYWLPSAFTPDGNGENDVLYVRGEGIVNFQFAIFNRWGEQLFYTTDTKQGWDGTKQDTHRQAPEGAYAYFVKGNLTNGTPVNVKGLVNLIR